MISITTNADQVAESLNKFSANLKSSLVDNSVAPFLNSVQAEARQSHRYHRRTGLLDRSIRISMDGDGGSVYLDDSVADYGKYIHEGTRHLNSDKFLYNAFDNRQRELDVRIDKAIDTALNQAGL